MQPYFQQQLQRGSNYKRETLPTDIRLAITLRILEGAEFLDVSLSFAIGISTTYTIFHKMVWVLDKVLSFPKLPTTEEGLHGVARGFKTSRRHTSPLDGCVGALNGICIKIAKPDRGSNPAFFIAARDITQSLSKRFVTPTKFLDMHPVFVEVLLTIRWEMNFLVSWRKSEGAYRV